MKEVEVKVVPVDEDIYEKLAEKGFKRFWKGKLKTVYYKGCSLDKNKVLRVRYGDKKLLSYKKRLVEDNVSVYYEIEVEVKGDVERLLKELGFEPFFEIEKYRDVWGRGEVKVMVERITSHPCVPLYVEIEGSEEKIEEVYRELSLKGKKLAVDSFKLISLYCGSLNV